MSNKPVTLQNIKHADLMLAVEAILARLPDEEYFLVLAAINQPTQQLDEMQATIADLKHELGAALDDLAAVESALNTAPDHNLTGLAAKVREALTERFEEGCEAASESVHDDVAYALHFGYGIDWDKAHAATSYLLSMDEYFEMGELSEKARTALFEFINTLGSQEESENE